MNQGGSMSITINLKLFALLQRFIPENASVYPIEDGVTVEDVIKRLGIPEGESKFAFVNNKKVEFDYVLQSGDTLGLFPYVTGG